jgi:hypothetical protein
MDQFMERITGKKKPEGDDAAVATAAEAAVPVVPVEPDKPREIKRAPESAQDMSAMRQLANESARRALGAHDGQRLISGTRTSFLGALCLSFISSLLAAGFYAGHMPWGWTSALLLMLLAGVLTWRFHSLCRKLQRLQGA